MGYPNPIKLNPLIENMATEETDTNLRYAPDGNGGVVAKAGSGGGAADTSELAVTDAATESLSEAAATQEDINVENKNAIEAIINQEAFPYTEVSANVNPALPNRTYLVDATGGIVVIKLPDVVAGNRDVFRVMLRSDGNHAQVTTVGGTQLLNGATSQEIATIQTGVSFKADGVGGYEILQDDREYYRNVEVTGNLDLSNGYESAGVYNCIPSIDTEIIITIPDPTADHAGLFAKFILNVDNGGSVRIVTVSGTATIGDATDVVIVFPYRGIELEDTGGEYLITQDSRPSAQASAVTFYALTEASPIPTYNRAAVSTTDPEYSTTATDFPTGAITGVDQLLGVFASDEGVIQGLINETNIIGSANFRRTSGSGTASVYTEVYKRSGGGTETLLTKTNNTSPISEATYTDKSSTGVLPATNFLSTDRVVIKVYADRIAGGSDPLMDMQLEGLAPAKLTMSVPSSTISHDSLAGVSDAGTGVSKGHVSDGAQSIAGAKTALDDAIFDKNISAKGNAITFATTMAPTFDNSVIQSVTLTDDFLLNLLLAPVNNSVMLIWFVQDGTGSRLMTVNAAFGTEGGTGVTLSTAIGARDLAAIIIDENGKQHISIIRTETK